MKMCDCDEMHCSLVLASRARGLSPGWTNPFFCYSFFPFFFSVFDCNNFSDDEWSLGVANLYPLIALQWYTLKSLLLSSVLCWKASWEYVDYSGCTSGATLWAVFQYFLLSYILT